VAKPDIHLRERLWGRRRILSLCKTAGLETATDGASGRRRPSLSPGSREDRPLDRLENNAYLMVAVFETVSKIAGELVPAGAARRVSGLPERPGAVKGAYAA
jgi:hypothetical protein